MPGGHTVAADDGSFASPPLAKDQSWSHAFEKPGSFGVHIKEHPGAKATIEVK
jgi:plastocyanin